MSAIQPYLEGIEGAELRRDASQFYSPAWLAELLWRWMLCRYELAGRSEPLRVLEPAAGRGALILPLFTLGIPVAKIVAYDIDTDNVKRLHELLAPTGIDYEVRARNFLADPEPGRFDISCLNPPFEDNQDIDFASRVLDCCTYAGGIFPARIEHSEGRAAFWRMTNPRRKMVLSKRPQFGGEHSPMTDFVLLDLERRKTVRRPGEASTTAIEWY